MTANDALGVSPGRAQESGADVAWLGCCAAAVGLDAVAVGGISSAHAVFALCAFAPLLGERLFSHALRSGDSQLLAPLAWVGALIVLAFAAGDQFGGFWAWLALPAAATMARANGERAVFEVLGLTAIAALTLLLLGVLSSPGIVGSFNSLGWISSLGVFVYVLVAADRRLGGGIAARGQRSPRSEAAGAVINASSEVFFVVDPARRIVAGAGGGSGKFCLAPETYVGADFVELFDAAEAAAIRRALDDARERRGGPGPRLTVRSPAGRCELTLSRGRLMDVVVAVRVVDDQIDRLEEAEHERDRAEALLRSRTRYFASMSHELRTPLNAVMGFSDAMRAKLFGPLPERYAEYVDLIHDSAEHMVELVGDILDVSKLEEGKYVLDLSTFNAAATVRSVERMMEPKAQERGVALSAQIEGEPLEVVADARALKQVLLNLVSNALKFTSRGGQVTLSAGFEGDELILACRDSGPGMTAEQVARIGRPFEQGEDGAKSEERGTGLGLSIVRSLCELHGGSLEVDSAPEKGSTFTIRIPRRTEPDRSTMAS
ncbi:MAG: HAMP domain-containing sensor histidine kinase [Maricaulaceae bacterium]